MLTGALLVTDLSTAHVWPPGTPDDGGSPVGVSADARLVADAAVLANGGHAHADWMELSPTKSFSVFLLETQKNHKT